MANKVRLIFVVAACCVAFPAYARDTGKEARMRETPFGVLEFLNWNSAWNSYKYADQKSLEKAAALMRQAGVQWVRMDFLWEDIEPRRGEFSFVKYDRIVALLRSKNIKILGLLDYCAPWACGNAGWNRPPDDDESFVDYARKVIRRYKGKVEYWEVWNEPDSPVYWEPQDGLKRYSVLLRKVYLEAKKVDRRCKILNGGLANGLVSLNHLYDNGAGPYFDIVNLHYFENPLREGALGAVGSVPRLAYTIMERNGDGGKRIWITEIGCPGIDKGAPETDDWWLGKNPREEEQAEWVKGVYETLLQDEHVARVFWAFFRDCKGHWNNGVDHFGLVRWDFSRKPAYWAYQDLTHGKKKPRRKIPGEI